MTVKSPSQASLLERVLEPHYWSFLLTADEYDRLEAHVRGRRPPVVLSELQHDAVARRKHAESQVRRNYHSFLVAFYGLRVERLGSAAFDPGTLQLTLPHDVRGLKDVGTQRAIDYLVQMVVDTPTDEPPKLTVDDCDMLQAWLKHCPGRPPDPQAKAQRRDHHERIAHLEATCEYNRNRLKRQHQASMLPKEQITDTTATVEPDLAPDTVKQGDRIEPQMRGEARALAVLAEHPDWTNKQIAIAAGVHVKSMPRWTRFKAAREAAQAAKYDRPVSHLDVRTGELQAEAKATCRHCDDEVRPWTCGECDTRIMDACRDCHAEVTHAR